MGVMDIIRKFGESKKESSMKFKEAEENMRIEKKLVERQKSANERELESYLKRQREEEIKSQLDLIHKKQNKDMWKSNSILAGKTTMLNNDRPILKEKNIFLDNKSKNPLNQNRMFFK